MSASFDGENNVWLLHRTATVAEQCVLTAVAVLRSHKLTQRDSSLEIARHILSSDSQVRRITGNSADDPYMNCFH